ncbi:MAG: DNA polymerase IV, partial [bacterium]|nr:DNA polymerase IV [bacterium]
MRIFLHIDMDYFFAQIEERRNPALRGHPVVVGADPQNGHGRGVVSTCNYEARKFGIRSALPISEAWRRCSNAVFLPCRMSLYGEVSHRIFEIVKQFADLSNFEQVSIDEAYLDISHVGSYDAAKTVGEKMRAEIFDREQLTASVGVGPNKLIAKIAAGFKKPNGLTVVRPDESANFLASMPSDVLYGVGPKTYERLQEIGVHTVNDILKKTIP